MSSSIRTGEADLGVIQRWRRAAAGRAGRVDAYHHPEAEALLAAGQARLVSENRTRRDRIASTLAAAGFLVAAVTLASVGPWRRPLEPIALIVAVAFYAVARKVRFPVAGVWAYPTQLAFVPMLFILPMPAVPLAVATSTVLLRVPEVLRGRRTAGWFVTDIGDCWYAIGPALVLVLAGAQGFAWSSWPLYAAAFGAQVVFDAAATLAICWFAEGIRPRAQLPLMMWTYAIDVSLSTAGLVVASATAQRPAVLLLVVPLTAVLALFARERQAHMRQSLVLSSAYRGTTFLLADMIEADDDYTGKHSQGVLELSLSVADALKLDATRRRNVEFAALLHDVGKVHVPKHIINKNGPLTDQEWAVIRRHTIQGEAMLNKIGGALTEVARIVRASHERYDGGGYPDGLAGTEIPIEARIVTACDAYSAMTTDRPYRKARAASAALAEMQACAGTQFDADVVSVLHEIIAVQAGLQDPMDHHPAVRAGSLALAVDVG
jgi:putative nucleotidyltransferase with HDIG domain